MGQDSISEEELYEDLSTCIVMIKHRIAQLVNQSAFQQDNQEQSRTTTTIEQLITKHQNFKITDPKRIKILERFQLRVKDMIRGLFVSGSQKLLLAVLVKKLEMLTIVSLTPQNSHLLLPNLLKVLLGPAYQKSSSMILTSSTPKRSSTTQKWARDRNGTIEPVETKPVLEETSEVQQIMKIIEKYRGIEVDEKHLRKEYFDIRDKKKDLFAQGLNRNKNIRNVMRNYDREYGNYVVKQSKISPSIKQARATSPKLEVYGPQRPLSLGLIAPKKYKNNSNLVTFDHPQRASEVKTTSHRCPQTTNFQELKSKAVKMQCYLMDLPLGPDEMAETNFKKVQFYKKTQEQLKYRYKFGHRQNQNRSAFPGLALKYRTISREGGQK